MRANRSDHHLYESYSLDSKSNNNNEKDRDAISCASLNIEQNSNLYYVSTNPNTKSDHRRASIKSSINPDSNRNGLIINGSLFDAELLQPIHSSYILDHNETPKDLNRFIEGHHMNSKSSQLDPHLFKISFVLTLSEWHVDKELLLDYCPVDDNKTHIIDEVSYYKKFCFPELNSKERKGGTLINEPATYIFTRTISDGQIEYGYCRRISYNNQITKFPVVICIVSTYPYFKLYDAILSELATAYASNELECNLLMLSFYSKPIPIPTLDSSGIVCKLNNRRVFFYVCPQDERLNHDYFYTLLSCLSPNYIVHLFESMLRSKKILCFSNSLSKLTKCCLALSLLLYPFMWPYPFVSVMPSSWLHDLLDTPCPYIYGCLSEIAQQNPLTMEQDSIHVNLDLNTIDIGIDDGFFLPLDLRQTLNASLEYLIRFRLIKSNINFINIFVSEACLHVFTELFHRLPDFFKRDLDSQRNIKDNDSGIDLQSIVSNDVEHQTTKTECKSEENRLGYEFRSDEFLILQPTSAYVTFLNDFIHGMIFLKFLDDYQRIDSNIKQPFSLFNQRLNERRRMTMDKLAINPVIRFRQTFDLLEKQVKPLSKITNPIMSKIVKKFFQ